jgi:hypothetical protein
MNFRILDYYCKTIAILTLYIFFWVNTGIFLVKLAIDSVKEFSKN